MLIKTAAIIKKLEIAWGTCYFSPLCTVCSKTPLKVYQIKRNLKNDYLIVSCNYIPRDRFDRHFQRHNRKWYQSNYNDCYKQPHDQNCAKYKFEQCLYFILPSNTKDFRIEMKYCSHKFGVFRLLHVNRYVNIIL